MLYPRAGRAQHQIRSFVRLRSPASAGTTRRRPSSSRKRLVSVLPLRFGVVGLAFEQALSPQLPSRVEVLLHVRPFAQREGGVFDALPWEWNASPWPSRDGYSHLGGRDFPQGSIRRRRRFHLLLEAVRRDVRRRGARPPRRRAQSEPRRHRRRRLPRPRAPAAGRRPAAGLRPRDAALRAHRRRGRRDAGRSGAVRLRRRRGAGPRRRAAAAGEVESSVWEAAARYQSIRRSAAGCGSASRRRRRARAAGAAAGARPASVRAPWDLSLDEFDNLPLEDRALAALAGRLQLPRVASTEETMSSSSAYCSSRCSTPTSASSRAPRARRQREVQRVGGGGGADLYAVQTSPRRASVWRRRWPRR